MRGEREFIAALKAVLPKTSSRVELGIGDDAAVLESPRGKLLATVDMVVEGVHFDRRYFEPGEIGHKALAVNLSDIAAMGGKPLYALVSLGLSDRDPEPFVRAVYEGLGTLASRHGVDVVGGNISRSRERFILDITLLGEASGTGVARTGAKSGDWVAVTGFLGDAAAGLHLLREKGRSACQTHPLLTRAQLTPEPRLDDGRRFVEWGGATSLIDISDGLGSELHHLGRASGVGFLIEEAKLPVREELKAIARAGGVDWRHWVFQGGEDYQLLVTVAPDSRLAKDSHLHFIGEVVSVDRGICLREADGRTSPLTDQGYDHVMGLSS